MRSKRALERAMKAVEGQMEGRAPHEYRLVHGEVCEITDNRVLMLVDGCKVVHIPKREIWGLEKVVVGTTDVWVTKIWWGRQ